MAKVKLQNVRLSFPALFEAEQFDSKGPFNYSATFLFEKNSDNHKRLLSAMNEVAKEAWKDKSATYLKNADGDSKLRFIVDGDTKEYDGYKGMMACRATRGKDKGRPLLLDQKPKLANGDDNVLTQDDGKPYAGCFVNCTLEVWAQDNKFGKAIRAQLLAVQFSKDGDAFGSNIKGSSDDYEDISDTGDDEELVA